MNVFDDRERGIAGQDLGGGMRQGWTWKPLGEVCKTGSGGTPLRSRREFYEGGTIPWLLSGEVAQGNVREAKNFITAAGLENSAAKLFPRGTVLVAMYGATAGQVGILRFEASTNQAVCGILPNDKFIPEFLYYLLLAKKDDLVAQATGNAQPNISQIKIKNTGVPVLPLPEQQRIVALLDEAFAGLATAKANAEQNLKNARAIFEIHLQSVFSQRGEGWVEATLGEVCEMYQPKTIGLKDLVSDGQYPVFGANGLIGHYDKFNHEGSQLLITCRGATCGSVNISDPFSWITGNAMVVRPLGESLDLGYLEYAFRGGINTSEAITGSAQPQITRTNLSPLPIGFPFSVQEQKRLAACFRSLAADTQHLTRLYERKLAALEELKKALLQQAFNGEI
jgi:type I restriction enzyme S subunit